MYPNLKAIKNSYVLLTICLVAVGFIFLIKPDIALNATCIIFGIYLIIYGIVKLIGYFTKDIYQLAFQFDFALGIISAIVGVVFIARTNAIVQLFSTCIGIIMLVEATLKIQTAFDSKRFGIEKWWLILIFAVLVAVVGIFLILLPYETTGIMVRLIGLNFILDGILNLIVVLSTVRTIRKMD